MKIGIDIGGSHLAVGLINEELKIVDKIDETYTLEEKKDLPKTIIEKIKLYINYLLKRNQLEIGNISIIGIACPGTIKDGYILRAGNLAIYNFHIVEELKKYFSTKMMIRNDAKCAALAEKAIGSLKNYQDSVFLTLGTGIGGAIFLKNYLLEPKQYSGFEIGHIIIEKNGRQCTCGKRGCFENYASMRALKEKIKKEYKLPQETHSKELMEILNNQTEKSNQILEEYLENLCVGLGILIDLFEPEIISIGGSFAYYETIFLERLKEKMQQNHRTFNNRKDIKYTLAKMKNDSGIIGSVIV